MMNRPIGFGVAFFFLMMIAGAALAQQRVQELKISAIPDENPQEIGRASCRERV